MAQLKKFGTFGGVFTPSILTILGVIMYLRLPMIVGTAGLWATIGIIIIAHIISVTTGLSVSSIATDKKVQAGGTYFMISRSLGLPIGGTLGLALFVGLSFSVSLYIIGFSESFLSYWGWEVDTNMIRITGSIALLAVTMITLISTSLALKMQFFIMAAIILSLVSIFFGNHEFAPETPNFGIPAISAPLMVLFGIFFPAVTGFEAGVSMSGDLQDPRKSIPGGTIWAIVVGFFVYILLAIFFAFTVQGQVLADDPQVLLNISLVPELVIAGIWGATISSALGSILGAPRILQATAVDNISPSIFAKGVGQTNEPRNALLLTFIIAEAGILIGELDIIARIVSIFFITTYGFLNLSATFEAWTSADYRPDFKIPIWVSGLGALACFIVMIQLDFLAMMGAIIILGLVYFFLKRKQLALESGDAWSGIWASLVKNGLERLNTEELHTRNWRPNILMFSGSKTERSHLVEMGQSIAGRLGMLTSFEIVASPMGTANKGTRIVDGENGKYFFNQFHSTDAYDGMESVSQLYGFSGVKPNTVLMGWTKKEKNRARFAQLMRSFRQGNLNTIFLQYNSERQYGNRKTIDLWWTGAGRNLSFAINLIRHITTDGIWKAAYIRLLLVVPDPSQADRLRKTINQLLIDYRVDIHIRLIDNSLKQLPQEQVIAEESAKSDLTIIGIDDRLLQQSSNVVERYQDLLKNMGSTLLIHAASNFEELDLGIQERKKDSKQGEIKKGIRLPALPEARNEWLKQDVLKIDTRNQLVLRGFYERSFAVYFQINLEVLDQLKKTFQGVYNTLEKDLENVDEKYRKLRALEKAKNDLTFRTRSLLENLRHERITDQQEAFQNGISWYQERLNADIQRFPQKTTIVYNRENLKIEKQDRWPIRYRKYYMRLKAWMLRRPAARYVRYREIATYYLKENRYTFLCALFNEWQIQSLGFLSEIRNQVMEYDQRLAYWQEHLDSFDLSVMEQEVQASISELEVFENQQIEMQKLWLSRIQLEYRRNLRSFIHTLETINGPSLLKKRRSPGKVYERLSTEIANFPEDWHQLALLQINTELLYIQLQTVENRVGQLYQEFSDEMLRAIDKQYVESLEEIAAWLKTELAHEQQEELSVEAVPALTFQQDLSATYESAVKLADQMPESLDINYSLSKKEELETVRVPVQRLTNYWLESTLYLPLQNRIGEAEQQLQRTSLTVRDILRLANLHTELDEYSEEETKALKDAERIINTEIEKIKNLQRDISKGIDDHLQKSYESLTPHEFVNQAGDIGGLVRAFQSQQVRTKVDQYQGRLRQVISNTGTRLLYSRSQGILLAKQLTEPEPQIQSHTDQVLSFVEQVSPSPEITRALPFYYHNLFTGKSDISADFWIERPIEMEQAERAIKRQKNGFGGAIMLLGERNSGKTALSWRIAKRFTRKEEKIIHVYPPVAGSIQLKDFNRALRQASVQEGSNEQIMRSLERDSVIIINDMEMWWERSAEGMAVVKELIRLIREHGQKFLFIVNTNQIAFQLINTLEPIEDYFLSVIAYKPFTTEEIERLILLRHWSGGMRFMLKNQEEDAISSWKKVQFFNRFFDFSKGNPGVALGAWLSCIEKVSGKHVHLRYPEIPDAEMFSDIPDDWIMVLVQFLLHKRLSVTRLVRVLNSNRNATLQLLQNMMRSGLISEKNNGVYQLNVYTEIHLINLFKEQEII